MYRRNRQSLIILVQVSQRLIPPMLIMLARLEDWMWISIQTIIGMARSSGWTYTKQCLTNIARQRRKSLMSALIATIATICWHPNLSSVFHCWTALFRWAVNTVMWIEEVTTKWSQKWLITRKKKSRSQWLQRSLTIAVDSGYWRCKQGFAMNTSTLTIITMICI